MFKIIFLILLSAHIVGDFYLQTERLAKKKEKYWKALLVHCVLYAMMCIVIILPVWSKYMLAGMLVMSISHALIDTAKYFYIKRLKVRKVNINTGKIYIVDQFIHIMLMGVIALWVVINIDKITLNQYVKNILDIVEVSPYSLLVWVVILLSVDKPCNITIKKILAVYKPRNQMKIRVKEKRVGAFVGLLERLIIIILLWNGQYSAIGLVLTAKSIARYNAISENVDFAEYYLLGTLLSTLMVILIYMLIM